MSHSYLIIMRGLSIIKGRVMPQSYRMYGTLVNVWHSLWLT